MRRQMINRALGGHNTEPVEVPPFAATAAGAVRLLLLELQPLVGDLATRALYVRSLHLARAGLKRPDRAASSSATLDALIAPFEQDLAGRDLDDARRVATSLLLSLADLLISLIGVDLTHRMLRSAWNLPADELPLEEKPQ